MKLSFGKTLLYSGWLFSILICRIELCHAQDFLTSQADRLANAPQPAELGYVESANGALHLEISLGSFPQRGSGGTLHYRLIYDGSIWSVNSAGVWSTSTVPPATGWHQTPVFAPAPVQAASSNQPPPPASACDTTYSDFNWTDPAGAIHFFPVKTIQLFDPSSTCATDTPSGDAFATDSSGYHLYVTNYVSSRLYAPDGTLVSGGPTDINGHVITSMDSNGNYLSYYLSIYAWDPSYIYDTAGHAFTGAAGSFGTVIPTSQGSSTFPVTYTTVVVKTAFGQPNVTECTTNCTINVVQSVELPDGTSYSFKYDCDSTSGNAACGSPGGQAAYYGVMTSMTLPTGGRIDYGYMTFSDAYGNRSRWLNSRSAAGGTWFYMPTVLTTCASQQDVGCKQKVTATKPNGDRTEYTFVLNNGAWPTEIDYFDGVTGNLLSSVFDTWDFSIPCPLTNCSGAAYIRKTVEAVSLPMPNGTSVTRKTEYAYDSPQAGNIISIREWNYISGVSLFPDKAKYITYLNTGTNNINRPSSVTLCSGVGSDPDCNGTGVKVAQRKITYDSYGSGNCRGQISGLISITGTANHDDAGFGSTYTARGNPTTVQDWISGANYLTTQYFYDTTGQVVQETDPAGNITCYDYADNFFTDIGASPPSTFTSAQATNAYLTSVTRPLIGSETYGYYFGSGKQAVFTDQNGAATYSHYLDSMDRPTSTIFPKGWNLTSYTGLMQVDSYAGVGEQSASAACTNCQHRQTAYDSMGRVRSEKLVNDPGGTVNIDTVYDVNGRVRTVSHPYRSISDPENVTEQVTYDGMDRILTNLHPDNQTTTNTYGALVATAGGIATQQGSTSIYGIGYPILVSDEAGKRTQKWIDGFNRVIEVDEPGDNFAGTDASGQLSVNGSVRVASGVGATPAQPGTGSLTIQGNERSVVDTSDCNLVNHIWVCTTIYDSGSVTLTVNGVPERCSYNRTTNKDATAMASCLAGLLNTDTASPVTATASSGTIGMTARIGGASTNYAFSVTSSWDTFDFGSTAAYTGNPASGALSGGADAYGGATVYDFGTVSLSVGGFTGQPVGYGSTVAVDVRFTNDSCSACSGTAVGGGDRNLFVNSISVGSTTILPGNPSVTYVGAPCNATSNGVGSLFCNGDMIATTSASGQSITVSAYGSPDYSIYPTMQLLVDGVVVGQWTVTGSSQNYTVTIPTGIATADQVASALAATMNVSGSPVTASASGSVITISYNTVGSAGNAAVSVNSTPDDPTLFPGGSFSGNTTLAGGQDPSSPSLANPYVTMYRYDAADHLTEVDQGAQTRSYLYDGIGRVISETTPEAGHVTRSYTTSTGSLCSGDPMDVCSITDARGVTTTFNYDALGRYLGASYTIPQNSSVTAMPNVCTISGTQSQANICIYYDQGGAASFALGHKTQMIDASGSERYEYDSVGQVTAVHKTIGSTTYNIGYQYDHIGNVTQIVYPSGRIVQQSYDAIGQLCEVAPSTTGCGTALNPYATAYSYDSAGHLTGFQYGNGVSANLSYSPDRALLSALSYKKNSEILFSENYFYKTDAAKCPNGNAGNDGQIQCIVDNVDSGRTLSYSYDPNRRLTSAVTKGSQAYNQWGLSWSYDRYGNRTTQTVTAGSGPSASLSFDAGTNRPDGYTFDAAGNLTREPLPIPNNFGYDAENRMTSYSGGGGAGTYVYDGHDLRVAKSSQGGTSTIYIFSGTKVIAEYDDGAAVAAPTREYIYAPVGEFTHLLATISGTTTTYEHSDHLSVRMSTDGSTGQVTGQQGHFPYGEPWYQIGSTTNWFFTTYEREGETGLDYAIARFYDSRVGSFCSADPVEGSADDPKSWNRYAYGGGDPVNVVDPRGEFPFALLALLLADLLEGMFIHGHNSANFGSQGESGEFDLPFLFFIPPMFVKDPPQNQPPPQTPPGYRACPPTWFWITGVTPKTATRAGAAGIKLHKGDVAFNPKNVGLSTEAAKRVEKSDNPILFKPDWSTAQITRGRNASKIMRPAPERGYPQVPNGLPDDGVLKGRDTIGGKGIDRSLNRNRIDQYGYDTEEHADAATRKVKVTVYLPIALKNAHCPK